MDNILSVAEVKSRFSELVSRVYSGERITIRRRERPMAVLISAADLERLERRAQLGQRLALALGQDIQILEQIEQGDLHPVMAAYGLWRDEEDLATLTDEITLNRQNQAARPAPEL
ncbi:MAG: type II toxin-antitoxin system prevent-host-death family antitoxin [Chloroflexi bacterium]|nr:type II toxin-antitoxin system prevent-host-death family antitoxin [Chloroflexota bacterium]